MRIALLEHDAETRLPARATLEALGHDCCDFSKASAFLHELRRETYDLLVLGWQLPDMRGVEVVRMVRAYGDGKLPVLLLAGELKEHEIVEGFTCGVDDAITLPLRGGEFAARVQALLRRVYPVAATHPTVWGRYHFALCRRRLEIDGRAVALTQKEFELAYLLFSHIGRLLSRKYLLDTIWAANNLSAHDVVSRTLDTHISRMRLVLGLRGEYGYRLVAVYGQGYRLDVVAPQEANDEEMPFDDFMQQFVPTLPPQPSGFGLLDWR